MNFVPYGEFVHVIRLGRGFTVTLCICFVQSRLITTI